MMNNDEYLIRINLYADMFNEMLKIVQIILVFLYDI